MTELSPEEIEEAAREAGISPAELRYALAEQAGVGALAPRVGSGLLPPSPRGRSAANVEGGLPFAPDQAVRAVKHQLERSLGSKGHMQGGNDADIFDERGGIIYRIQSADDGGGGSLVRIDVDPTPLRGRRLLTGVALGATVGLFALAGLTIPGLIGWGLLAGGAALGVLGTGSLATMGVRAVPAQLADDRQALVEAEQGAPIGGASALVGGREAMLALPAARSGSSPEF
ncbi:MAG: hypothetical protein KC431_07280 [Myxococcales bacterium]|nr:hypothetical protein [Myxococcales bacterium]